MTNPADLTDITAIPETGRLVAIDPGTKRVGIAVSDELRVTARPLPVIARTSWKKLLSKINDTLTEFDAAALIVGLPYNFDGTESEMSQEARRIARNLSLSLEIPVVLQDERATTYEARGRMWQRRADRADFARTLDSEAAVIILSDLMDRLSNK